MMDYKELISKLEYQAETIRNMNCTTMTADEFESAAAAIETLLAERDAAVEDLRGICWCCKHGKQWEQSGPLSKLTACEHLDECGVLACGGRASKCQHWQWRGPKEGDAHEP